MLEKISDILNLDERDSDILYQLTSISSKISPLKETLKNKLSLANSLTSLVKVPKGIKITKNDWEDIVKHLKIKIKG